MDAQKRSPVGAGLPHRALPMLSTLAENSSGGNQLGYILGEQIPTRLRGQGSRRYVAQDALRRETHMLPPAFGGRWGTHDMACGGSGWHALKKGGTH